MRIVPTPDIRPHHCAVFPQLGQSYQGGFLDTGSELVGGHDNHVYLSRVAIEEACKTFGMPTQAEHDELRQAHEELLERAARLEAENNEQAQKLDAIGVLRLYGAKTEKKPGRPAKNTTTKTGAAA